MDIEDVVQLIRDEAVPALVRTDDDSIGYCNNWSSPISGPDDPAAGYTREWMSENFTSDCFGNGNILGMIMVNGPDMGKQRWVPENKCTIVGVTVDSAARAVVDYIDEVHDDDDDW